MGYWRSRSTSLLLIFTPKIDLDLDYTSFDRLLFLISADFRLGDLTVSENLSFYIELSFLAVNLYQENLITLVPLKTYKNVPKTGSDNTTKTTATKNGGDTLMIFMMKT